MGWNLLEKARRFRNLLEDNGLNVLPFESQIVPIVLGDNEKAVRFSGILIAKGLLVKAIRPPTVPVGTARIRLSLTLSMSEAALSKAAGIIAEAAKEVGMAGGSDPG